MSNYVRDLRLNLNALVATAMIPIGVCGTGAGVLHIDVLDVHGVRALIVVRLTLRPCNDVLVVSLVSSGPVSEEKLDRGLGIVLSTNSILIHQSADDVSVDDPLHLVLGPIGGVVVEIILGCKGEWMVDGTVVCGGVALPEVVGLDHGSVTTEELRIKTSMSA